MPLRRPSQLNYFSSETEVSASLSLGYEAAKPAEWRRSDTVVGRERNHDWFEAGRRTTSDLRIAFHAPILIHVAVD
jgi:hypothetical protein